MILIKFTDFVRINFHKDVDYIEEIIERAKSETDDVEAEIIYNEWTDAYREACEYGDN